MVQHINKRGDAWTSNTQHAKKIGWHMYIIGMVFKKEECDIDVTSRVPEENGSCMDVIGRV